MAFRVSKKSNHSTTDCFMTSRISKQVLVEQVLYVPKSVTPTSSAPNSPGLLKDGGSSRGSPTVPTTDWSRPGDKIRGRPAPLASPFLDRVPDDDDAQLTNRTDTSFFDPASRKGPGSDDRSSSKPSDQQEVVTPQLVIDMVKPEFRNLRVVTDLRDLEKRGAVLTPLLNKSPLSDNTASSGFTESPGLDPYAADPMVVTVRRHRWIRQNNPYRKRLDPETEARHQELEGKLTFVPYPKRSVVNVHSPDWKKRNGGAAGSSSSHPNSPLLPNGSAPAAAAAAANTNTTANVSSKEEPEQIPVPPPHDEAMVRLFVGQVPSTITLSQLQWIFHTLAGAPVYNCERITKDRAPYVDPVTHQQIDVPQIVHPETGVLLRERVASGCVHLLVSASDTAEVLGRLHKKCLLDIGGAWIARNDKEQKVMDEYIASIKQKATTGQMARTFQGILPTDSVVVQTAQSQTRSRATFWVTNNPHTEILGLPVHQPPAPMAHRGPGAAGPRYFQHHQQQHHHHQQQQHYHQQMPPQQQQHYFYHQQQQQQGGGPQSFYVMYPPSSQAPPPPPPAYRPNESKPPLTSPTADGGAAPASASSAQPSQLPPPHYNPVIGGYNAPPQQHQQQQYYQQNQFHHQYHQQQQGYAGIHPQTGQPIYYA
jgi:hypothetical protein